MKKNQLIIIYLLTFLVFTYLLKLLGFISITGSEILSYTLIFTGFGLFYNSFGKENKSLLFSSTFIFLWGVVLFLINNFEFRNNSEILYPALFLNIGFSLLVLFIDNVKDKIYLLLSLIFLLLGTITVFYWGKFNSSIFFSSFGEIAIKYLPIIIIVIGIFFILKRSEKK